MAISRLRPNNDIALSSLNCSNSFIILYTEQVPCQLTYPSLLAGSNLQSHPCHFRHRASSHPNRHRLPVRWASSHEGRPRCFECSPALRALVLSCSCRRVKSSYPYLYTAGSVPTCRSGAARPVQLLVSILDVERSVELGIPTGLLLITLAVNLLPSFHLCEPFVQVALEFVFVFHNLYPIHSRFRANLQAGRSGPAATTPSLGRGVAQLWLLLRYLTLAIPYFDFP